MHTARETALATLRGAPGSPSVALVLSGGGARGAYEVGVLAGLADLLDRGAASRPLFDVVAGTSVGAINAAHVVAHANRADRGIPELIDRWASLELETHLRPIVGEFLGLAPLRHSRRVAAPTGPRWGRALLDARPFERMLQGHFPWAALHDNVRRGVVGAFIVSALNVANGRTVSFVELAPSRAYVPSRDARRDARVGAITADHVLASAAIPLLFPARRVGGSYFCDGGLRFNTPMSPAIRAGADRLFVIALRAGQASSADDEALESYPNPIFLLGKLFDALLLDPIEYDLQVLERMNLVYDVLGEATSPQTVARVGRVVEKDRGLPYRRIETLVFRPSRPLGVLALEHYRARRVKLCSGAGTTMLLENAAALGARVEADFLSYVLFDGAFARALIDLGRCDVEARAGEVEAFFARGPREAETYL